VAVPRDCGDGILTNHRVCTACQANLMPDIGGDFVWLQPLKGVMNSDPLTERFMDRFFQRVIQVWFATQDKGKTVEGIISALMKTAA
jgi:hypothetical protein